MNLVELRKRIMRATCALVAAGSILLSACGGSSSSTETAGIGGTGIGVGGTGIVVGKITGFGSVLVNGGTFDIDTSQFNVDGDTGASQSDLRLGMVIILEVETENGVIPVNGKALEVIYDDQVEGPVTNVVTDLMDPTIKAGTVFDQTITFDEGSTIFEGTSFGSIGNEGNPNFDVIEVSGFRTSATDVVATYVRFIEDLQPGSEAELRGNISALAGAPPDQTFMIGTTSITTNAGTVIDVPGGVLFETQYIEVKGDITGPATILATRIEEEDEDFDDDVDDVSLQGIVVDYIDVGNFTVGNQPVDATNAVFKPASLEGMDLQGMNVEVEGEIVGGKLIAEEVEARDGDSKLRSEISMVDTVNYEFFKVIFPVAAMPNEVTVRVDGQTLFEDETGPVTTPPFSLDDLMATDFVRVEGREIAANEILATVIKRRAPESKLKLEGAVDGYNPGTSITILGVEYGLNVFTDYEPDPPNIVVGDLVELEDEDNLPNSPYGIADEVEEE